MKKTLSNLIGKKFSVYEGGEFSRMTDFLGYMDLLARFSDFFSYSTKEKYEILKETEDTKIGYIDSMIYVKLGK